MRIGITDSGVGGLSVCAELEALLGRSPIGEDVEILYLNAALQDDFSYNSMPSRQQKLEAFDRFLDNTTQKYRPDLLFIACNTLSVLFRDPCFDAYREIPILGIVEAATKEIVSVFHETSDSHIVVFATPTTVAESTYSHESVRAGVPADRIVQQACPDLPDAISNDYSGALATGLLKDYVPAALQQFPAMPGKVLAFLGCTHYGYQARLFKELLHQHVESVHILNPNPAAACTILERLNPQPGSGSLDIRFITPYAIPARPLRSLSHYLGERAPGTVAALQNFTRDPDLYRPGC